MNWLYGVIFATDICEMLHLSLCLLQFKQKRQNERETEKGQKTKTGANINSSKMN